MPHRKVQPALAIFKHSGVSYQCMEVCVALCAGGVNIFIPDCTELK